VSVGVAWRTAPSGSGRYVGGLTITFTCDPSSSARLVDMALSEFEHLQVPPLPSSPQPPLPGWRTRLSQGIWNTCTGRNLRDALRHEDARSVEMAHKQTNFWDFLSMKGVNDACPQAKDAQKTANASSGRRARFRFFPARACDPPPPISTLCAPLHCFPSLWKRSCYNCVTVGFEWGAGTAHTTH